MSLSGFVRVVVVIACILASYPSAAQQTAGPNLAEIKPAADAFTLAEAVPSWVVETATPDVGAPAPIVVRLAETQYLVDREPVAFVRRVTAVNDAASLAGAGHIAISFAQDYERVQLHWIRIQRGPEQIDRTKVSKLRFLQREQGLEQGVYSGYVTASILIDDLRVGDTIDVAYSLHGQNPVFAGKFIGVASWDQSYPTLRRHVIFSHLASRQIAWRMIGDRTGSPVAPTETVRDGLRTLDFDERGLREAVADAQTPQDYFAFRFLQFSEFGSWKEVAQWATALFELNAAPNDEVDDLAKKIGGLDADGDRVTAALQIVQSQIRYFSVSLGESSHRPAAPDIVLRRRYGDCKDKSFLLVTLLRRLGIQSRPVLLQVGRRRGLEEVLPSPEFFDHVIVEAIVGGKSYFLDPTRLGQYGRLDRMGQAHEGIQILPVASDTERPSSIPERAVDEVDDDLTERVTVAKLGEDAQLSLKRVWSGLSAERLRLAFEQTTREMIAKRVGDMLEGKYPGAMLIADPAVHDDQEQNILSLEATFRVPKIAVERNGTWVIGYKPDNQAGVLPLPSSATRSMPLGISSYPYHARYQIEITLPDAVSVVADPYTETVANDHFNLTSSRYFRGNVARSVVELTTLRPFVESDKYSKYADDLRTANRAIVGYFAVGKSDIKSSEAGADQATDRFHRMLLDAVQKTTETISSGKLSGADLADALCQRGSSLAELGRVDEALRDVNEAFRLIPNTSEAFSCRGGTLYESGQFEKAIADLSKSISLGSINASTYRTRAAARLYAGQTEQAAADFARAVELADGENKIYCELWMLAALGRAGKPVPDELAQRARATANGAWPLPALAMMTGALSPDDLLKTFADKKGDERRMLLSEAYFYIGQHDMARGDKQAAKLNFEKSREQGVILYTEHIAAGFELQRLARESVGAAVAPAANPLP
ncbi:DUF3857 domain-containing protein [Bradyrhizobium sp. HKCCYLS20291]|uniref:DUF3857 domain-containing protein n=1 Tax=Bradyrhizobium sp. HKCCYLS20291 TaxID=3420766 RepID=UPI003EB867BD